MPGIRRAATGYLHGKVQRLAGAHPTGDLPARDCVLACFDVPRENMRVLSIGTGASTFTVDADAQKGGVAQWAFMRSFNAAARAQSKNALGQAFLLLGKPNVMRIDPPETDRPIAMDDVDRSLRELPEMARSLTEGSGPSHQWHLLQQTRPRRLCLAQSDKLLQVRNR